MRKNASSPVLKVARRADLPSPLLLRLRPHGRAAVRVLDKAGAPAVGVTVKTFAMGAVPDAEAVSNAEGIAFFEPQGTWLSLYAREALAEDATLCSEGSGFRGFTLAHNVASPEAVDALLDQAVSAGAVLVKPGQKFTYLEVIRSYPIKWRQPSSQNMVEAIESFDFVNSCSIRSLLNDTNSCRVTSCIGTNLTGVALGDIITSRTKSYFLFDLFNDIG